MSRRSAREVAMRYLYRRDMNGEPAEEMDAAEDPLLVDVTALDARDRKFVSRVEKLYPDKAADIDAAIAANLKRWRFDRVAKVDLAILRLAVLEICAMGTPPKTAVNEAVELAKAYSSEKAYQFVNGVLAGYLKTI